MPADPATAKPRCTRSDSTVPGVGGWASAISPSWASGGRRIVYGRLERSPNEPGGIFSVAARGGPPRRVASTTFSYLVRPAVSFDGSRIAYLRTGVADGGVRWEWWLR